jgi:hypothetical protein
VPRTVELVTQAGTQTKLIGLGICDGLPGSECPGGAVCHQTQISEEVSYRISNLFDGSASFVGTTKVRCAFANGNSLGFIE